MPMSGALSLDLSKWFNISRDMTTPTNGSVQHTKVLFVFQKRHLSVRGELCEVPTSSSPFHRKRKIKAGFFENWEENLVSKMRASNDHCFERTFILDCFILLHKLIAMPQRRFNTASSLLTAFSALNTFGSFC